MVNKPPYKSAKPPKTKRKKHPVPTPLENNSYPDSAVYYPITPVGRFKEKKSYNLSLEDKNHVMTFRSVKSGLEQQRQLKIHEWIELLFQLESGRLAEEDTKALLAQIDELHTKYGEQLVLLQDNPNSSITPPNPSLLTFLETYAPKLRASLAKRREHEVRTSLNKLQYWTAYSSKLREDLKNQTTERTRTVVYELAKRLSFSMPFQRTLKAFRKKWHIEIDKKFVTYLMNSQRDVLEPTNLIRVMSGRAPDFEVPEQFYDDLNQLIFGTFPLLDANEDFGLIVAAIYIGLEPEEVLHNWSEIWLIASYQNREQLRVETRIDETLSLTGALLTIAYLIEHTKVDWSPEQNQQRIISTDQISSIQPEQEQGYLHENPPPIISAWIKFALDQSQEFTNRGFDNIPEILEQIQAISHTNPTPIVDKTDIAVRITPATLKDHLQQLWTKIELTRIAEWGEQKPIRNIQVWREYERDVRLKQLYDKIEAKGGKATDREVTAMYLKELSEERQAIIKEEKDKKKREKMEEDEKTNFLWRDSALTEDLTKKARQAWSKKVRQLNGKV